MTIKKIKNNDVTTDKPLYHIVQPEELLSNGELILSFSIPGQPATKKTSQRIFRRRILPSKAYCEYEKYCEPFCKKAWIDTGKSPIDFGVSINLSVYLKSWIVGDCTGYQQSIADIMQKHGVLANDSWIHWDWEGNHWFAGVDKENPRVEITIKRFKHPKEDYRAEQELALKNKEERKQARLKKCLLNKINEK
jgi:Holliday junction resolvase RusA-like endonuclease